MSENFATLLLSYLGPRRSGTQLLISRLTEEQNARIDGGQRAEGGILKVLETLYYRVANPILKSEVLVALVWLWAKLEERI